MLEDLGPAPLCLELDLDSFDGPREWIVQFRRRSGWLVLADCTIQSAHDLMTTRLIAACDDRETPIPFFRARHLTECAWANVAECDELPPDILDDLICEEQGALLARWQRETNVDLAAAFEAGEIRIAELEGRARALARRNERQAADLRQRRRHPDATPAMRAAMAEVIRQLEDENDAAAADLARARAAMRAEAEAAEERLWARDDLLLEVERVQVIRWRARGAMRDRLPERRRPYATAFIPACGRTGVEEQTAAEVLVQFDTALARSAQQAARRKTAEEVRHHAQDLLAGKRQVLPPAPRLSCEPAMPPAKLASLPKHSPALRKLREQAMPRPGSKPGSFNWTNARVALLTQMWLDGKGPTDIARALGGIRRNRVIGKAHRLGLPPRNKGKPAEAALSSATPVGQEAAQAEPVQRALDALAWAKQRYWGKEG